MPGDDHTAATGPLLIIVAVADGQSSLLVGVLQDVCVLVLADASEEDYRVRWEQILGGRTISYTNLITLMA